MMTNQKPSINRMSVESNLAKQKRREKYATPRELAAKSKALVNGGISEKSIRNIERGEKVKLDTLEKYCSCIGVSANDIGAIDGTGQWEQEYQELRNHYGSPDIHLAGTVFGALSQNAYDKLSERFSDQEILQVLHDHSFVVDDSVLALLPKPTAEIAARIEEGASKPRTHQYIRADMSEANELATHQVEQEMMWLIDQELTAPDEAIESLSLIHEKTNTLYASQLFVAPHSADVAIGRLKLRSSIIELLDSLKEKHGLHFLYCNAVEECIVDVNEENQRLNFRSQESERGVLFLTFTTNELARIRYERWISLSVPDLTDFVMQQRNNL
ncbi:hypothetical protein N8575_05925 [Gammaproteobacteria bacterium]|nr:hypothetical protein [Gammaproteobacteria bacterium]